MTKQIVFAAEFRTVLHETIREMAAQTREEIQTTVDRLVRLASETIPFVELGGLQDLGCLPGLPWNIVLSSEANNAVTVVAGVELSKGVDTDVESRIVEKVNEVLNRNVKMGRRIFVVVPWEKPS